MAALSYDVAGSGRPLVLVHGWCCNRRHMAGLTENFARAYRVYSIDLPGHGETPIGRTDLRMEALAEAVARFLDELDLQQAVLIGHSMGGVLSVFAGGLRPERVAGVVNLDGALPLKPAAREGYKALFAAIQEQGFRTLMPEFLRKVFFLPEELGETAEGIIADMVSAPEKQALALLKEFPIVDAAKALGNLRAPLLYIGGSQPRFDEQEVLALRPGTSIARVALGGHFIQVFALNQVVPMIEHFLDRIGPSNTAP